MSKLGSSLFQCLEGGECERRQGLAVSLMVWKSPFSCLCSLLLLELQVPTTTPPSLLFNFFVLLKARACLELLMYTRLALDSQRLKACANIPKPLLLNFWSFFCSHFFLVCEARPLKFQRPVLNSWSLPKCWDYNCVPSHLSSFFKHKLLKPGMVGHTFNSNRGRHISVHSKPAWATEWDPISKTTTKLVNYYFLAPHLSSMYVIFCH